MDEQQRLHILDDLKGCIKGELLFDELSRALYSTDASIFQVQPAGVVLPCDEEDVQNLVRYAAENELALIARGAGSGTAGEALGRGLIVDMSRNFREIGEIGEDTVRVQVGATFQELNDRLAGAGRRIVPDPARGKHSTIGGMLATNASGPRVMQQGYVRDYVRGLRVILDSGNIAWVGKEPAIPTLPASPLQKIVSAAALLLDDSADVIQKTLPRTRYNRCGYLLDGVMQNGKIDLPRLLTGSEGTLAIFTEATLRTAPVPEGRSLVLLGFSSLEKGLEAAQLALVTDPCICEIADRRLFTLARERHDDIAAVLTPNTEAVLFVEYETETAGEARWAAKRLPYFLTRHDCEPLSSIDAYERPEVEQLWQIRENILPSQYGMRAGKRPAPMIEDVGVPPDELTKFLLGVQEILQDYAVTACYLINAGTGQVDARPFLDLTSRRDVAVLREITEQIHGLALEMGGTVSTRHGTGIARTPWVARQYRRLYPVFGQLKYIFDPNNLFNPGKIVDPDPRWSRWPLRTVASSEAKTAVVLGWRDDSIQEECQKCNGCGECRGAAPAQRMCPIFHATHAEAASPRAKANLLRNLLASGDETPGISSPEVRAVADLCVNCKMCALECPAHVNIPKLMLEAKAANVAEHGVDRRDWFFARIENLAGWAGRFPSLANFLLARRSTRWLMQKMFGLSAKRRMPQFAWRSFQREVRRKGWSKPAGFGTNRVAYFPGIFANYIDPSIGRAAVAILEHNGLDVFVPARQYGCGMAALSAGDAEAAREIARRNLRSLADSARDGIPIVCSEPTAALALRQEYPNLLDEDEAQLVADQTVELTTFLWRLHEDGNLRTDFEPLSFSLGHHVPCHLRALGEPAAGPRLLELIPGVAVDTIDVSCSGMAGTYGMQASNYDVSLEAGRPMLKHLRDSDVTLGSTECSACRMQMEDGSDKRTLHPVQYLALAYGLLPEINRRLLQPVGNRTLL